MKKQNKKIIVLLMVLIVIGIFIFIQNYNESTEIMKKDGIFVFKYIFVQEQGTSINLDNICNEKVIELSDKNLFCNAKIISRSIDNGIDNLIWDLNCECRKR